MISESPAMFGYSHESYLPCELHEVVGHLQKRSINANVKEKVGLKEDVCVIPLNRGYLIYTKELFLCTNDWKPLSQINGKHALADLSGTQEMRSYLQQLHHYNLLSFGSNNGQVKVIDIDKKYLEKYQDKGFITFPLVPITVELDITNVCNFACIHCHKDSKPLHLTKELSTKEILAIIEKCAQIGVPELILMGGEPLIHPDFLDFVKYAKEKGIRDIRTSTNGWIIDETLAEELAKYFDNIQISIHGASASTHDFITKKKGAWQKAKRAIRLLKKRNIKVNVAFTVMRDNINDIKRIPYTAMEWGADSLRFLRLTCTGRGSLLRGWSESEITRISEEIKKIQENLSNCSLCFALDVGGFSPLNEIRNDATFYGCAAGRILLHIAFDGQVNACGSIEGNFIGNVRERNSDILDIWHSPELIEMRRQLECHCSYRPICSGPCKVEEAVPNKA